MYDPKKLLSSNQMKKMNVSLIQFFSQLILLTNSEKKKKKLIILTIEYVPLRFFYIFVSALSFTIYLLFVFACKLSK